MIHYTFIVLPEEENLRLDKVLTARLQDKTSRTHIQEMIAEGGVKINGKQLLKRARLHTGDKIEVSWKERSPLQAKAQAIDLNILFEDDAIIVINKPAGMVVHPAPGSPDQTFVNALLHHVGDLEGQDLLRPGIVHRLDKDTSGVMVAAKTREAHQRLIEQFSLRKVEKRYLAICVGALCDQTISLPIKRSLSDRKKMAVVEGGKEAVTTFKILKKGAELSLVEACPKTGRTHQIRVHLQYLRAPILGDPLYGSAVKNRKYKIDKTLLHAQKLTLYHPLSQEKMSFEAPLPEIFQAILATF